MDKVGCWASPHPSHPGTSHPPLPALQHLPKGLIEDLLPGPVTLLLTRRAEAPLAEELNPGVEAIGGWAGYSCDIVSPCLF